MRKGVIPKRPDHCELCLRQACRRGYPFGQALEAHHWRGYEYPLDVWWVCRSCNRKLSHRHDGSLTIEEAREVIHLSRKERDAFVGKNQAPDAQVCDRPYPTGICPICNRTFARRSGLSKHIQCAHGISLRDYERNAQPA